MNEEYLKFARMMAIKSCLRNHNPFWQDDVFQVFESICHIENNHLYKLMNDWFTENTGEDSANFQEIKSIVLSEYESLKSKESSLEDEFKLAMKEAFPIMQEKKKQITELSKDMISISEKYKLPFTILDEFDGCKIIYIPTFFAISKNSNKIIQKKIQEIIKDTGVKIDYYDG